MGSNQGACSIAKKLKTVDHCVKRVLCLRIQSKCGKNADQNNTFYTVDYANIFLLLNIRSLVAPNTTVGEIFNILVLPFSE